MLIHELSKQLVERGHEVSVFTTDALNRNRRKVTEVNGIKVYEFKSVTNHVAAAFHINIYLSPSMVHALRRSLQNFDIIHLHEYRTFQNLIVGYYAIKMGIPYIVQAHGSIPTSTGKPIIGSLYDLLWGRKLLAHAVKVIAVTPQEAEQYRKIGINSEKIEIVPNAIDLTSFNELPEKGRFRKRYGLSDKKLILFLARIHKIKGLDLLAEAFFELSKEVDNVELVIAGPDYGYLKEIKKKIEKLKIRDKVLFVGALHGERKLEAYVDSDIYVLPSIYETFPVTVLEACACGTPVIVTDRCGIANIIDGQAGYAVPFDKDRLKGAFTSMLSDERMRQKFGEQGKLLVHERFTWSKVASQMESIYLSCLQDAKSARDLKDGYGYEHSRSVQ